MKSHLFLENSENCLSNLVFQKMECTFCDFVKVIFKLPKYETSCNCTRKKMDSSRWIDEIDSKNGSNFCLQEQLKLQLCCIETNCRMVGSSHRYPWIGVFDYCNLENDPNAGLSP